jgi:hypothetical protein
MSEAKKPNNLSAALNACHKVFADAPDSDFQMGTPLEGTVERPVAEGGLESTFDYASKYAGVTFEQAAAVTCALTHKGWKRSMPTASDASLEFTLSLAGCVKDATNPCGWRNKRAEEAEAEVEILKIAMSLTCELHGCASKNCTAARFHQDAEDLIERFSAVEAKFTDQMDQLNQLKKYAYSGYEDDGDSDFKYGYNTALRGLRRMLNLEQPTKSSSTPQDAAKWISVKEKNPKQDQDILYVVQGTAHSKPTVVRGMRCCDISSGWWWCDEEGISDDYGNDGLESFVIWWMPTPTAPLNLEQPKGDS